MKPLATILALGVFLLSAATSRAADGKGARLDVIEFSGPALKGNPLRDPVVRRLAVFVPAGRTNGDRMPVIYYLPGYGSSSEGFIQQPQKWLALTQKLAQEVTPMVMVVVDGRTRWGGSQYLNSRAQGNYADYVCKDILRLVESRFPSPKNGVRRVIAGHSSGGFGALRLGMAFPKLFDGVIALSPDSDFPVTHLPLIKRPGVTNASLEQVRRINSGRQAVPKDQDLIYAIGLSAAYAPRGRFHSGDFEWLYDGQGSFRENVWQRWLENDPLTIARKNPLCFPATQAVYLDGAAHDEYSANVGARAIYETIRNGSARCAFSEPPGRHGDRVRERLEGGLVWIFKRS